MRDSKVIVHKITLAPEINPADKKAFTREVMHRLGSEKGLDLQWMAVEHNNTDHHHIHVVVLGKDQNGKDVRFDKKDYDRIKEYGDRFLERCHPLELEKARSEREKKAKERIEQRTRERDERIRDGLELPYMHKLILREQLEPYTQWKERQLEKERAKAARSKEKLTQRIEAPRMREKNSSEQLDQQQERQLENKEIGAAESKEALLEDLEAPIFQDTIEAAGKEWNKQNSLAELQELNQYLWDNYAERISRDDYKKLLSWMKEKEGHPERLMNAVDDRKSTPDLPKKPEKPTDQFEHKGEIYSKDSSYEKLTDLSKRLREKKTDWLPVKNYQQLRGWIENADRARWSGVLEQQIELSKQQYGREGAQKTMPDAHRWVNPMQQDFMRNPVVGLFMTGASVANELVSWIPLTDMRDRLKEGRDALEAAKLDKHKQHVKPGRKAEQKDRDKEAIEKLDQAIDDNQATRDKANDEKKRKQHDRDNEDPFTFDPWGRF
jgi:hypothetical protein